MYPFFVFQLPHNATDEQVEARYSELLRRYPPDRAAREFALVRGAYEALRTSSARLQTRLFYMDRTGMSLLDEYPWWLERRPRKRLRPDELAMLIRLGAAPRNTKPRSRSNDHGRS